MNKQKVFNLIVKPAILVVAIIVLIVMLRSSNDDTKSMSTEIPMSTVTDVNTELAAIEEVESEIEFTGQNAYTYEKGDISYLEENCGALIDYCNTNDISIESVDIHDYGEDIEICVLFKDSDYYAMVYCNKKSNSYEYYIFDINGIVDSF